MADRDIRAGLRALHLEPPEDEATREALAAIAVRSDPSTVIRALLAHYSDGKGQVVETTRGLSPLLWEAARQAGGRMSSPRREVLAVEDATGAEVCRVVYEVQLGDVVEDEEGRFRVVEKARTWQEIGALIDAMPE